MPRLRPFRRGSSMGLQRSPCRPGALDMTPHQFVRIQIGRVARKEVQRQSSAGRLHVVFDQGLLVRGQTVDDQVHRRLR